eukprot:15467657-Alexandrium_andersonii.AAC.1
MGRDLPFANAMRRGAELRPPNRRCAPTAHELLIDAHRNPAAVNRVVGPDRLHAGHRCHDALDHRAVERVYLSCDLQVPVGRDQLQGQ